MLAAMIERVGLVHEVLKAQTLGFLALPNIAPFNTGNI